MDKRYQVFVSSTYEDLRTERQEVMHALLELDCIPCGMELFPAANEDQWSLIKKVIDDCDYYIVISAGRYGSIGPKGMSYTEMEYRYALETGKPVIAFLHKDPTTLTVKLTEQSDGGKRRHGEFREILQQRMCKYWDGAAELGSVVSRSLVRLIKTNPAVGWIKSNEIVDGVAAAEILRLRKRTEELESQLTKGRHNAPPGTDQLSQGTELCTLHVSFRALRKPTYQNTRFEDYAIEVSWNDLVYDVGPMLMSPTNELSFHSALTSSCSKHLIALSQRKKDLKELDEIKSVSVSAHDFQTVKIQLRALGIIDRSGAMWSLTPFGDQMVTQLRALPMKSVKRSKP